jgi:SH3 domain protein
VKHLLLALTLCISTTVIAETAYVSDELEIMVRSGKTPTHRIIATLKSGKKINVIENDQASGYSKIKLGATRDGWVLTRLINKRPSAKSRLAKAEAALKTLQAQAATSNEKLAQLGEQKGNLDSESSELKKLNTSLSRELEVLRETSRTAVQIREERDTLQQRVVTNERELETVKRENDMLKNSDAQDWFMIGSGVLLFGILLGFILPKLSWRKKSSWQSTF